MNQRISLLCADGSCNCQNEVLADVNENFHKLNSDEQMKVIDLANSRRGEAFETEVKGLYILLTPNTCDACGSSC